MTKKHLFWIILLGTIAYLLPLMFLAIWTR